MRFTYTTEVINDKLVTFLEETGGVFYGFTTDQVALVAEKLYPNYQSNNMSDIFPSIYFNYCLRRILNGQDIPNTYIPKNLKILKENQFNNLDE